MPESCILSKFYIKPQRRGWPTLWIGRCILSKFYIKPQPILCISFSNSVVSYRNSTSNHNLFGTNCLYNELYLIEILHQTTTPSPLAVFLLSCILSKFYIKPQRLLQPHLQRYVVSYRNSTSNHNSGGSLVAPGSVVSYRNSTSNHNSVTEYTPLSRLYLIEILHQTTTYSGLTVFTTSCILSKFYIKPQL